MERIYLYVPPEEYAEVKASGACWDDHSKRWYVDREMVSATVSRWMGKEEEGEFGIESEEAFVAAAKTSCSNCGEEIEVVGVYCESGIDLETGDVLERVTLSNITSMDEALAAMVESRGFFCAADESEAAGYFASHCTHCGAVQEDYLLHSEPGDVFFSIPEAGPGAIELWAVKGRIRVSGDWGFGV